MKWTISRQIWHLRMRFQCHAHLSSWHYSWRIHRGLKSVLCISMTRPLDKALTLKDMTASCKFRTPTASVRFPWQESLLCAGSGRRKGAGGGDRLACKTWRRRSTALGISFHKLRRVAITVVTVIGRSRQSFTGIDRLKPVSYITSPYKIRRSKQNFKRKMNIMIWFSNFIIY